MNGSGAYDEAVSVTWFDHDCEWLTKYCEENHAKQALVPRSVLAQYVVASGDYPSSGAAS